MKRLVLLATSADAFQVSRCSWRDLTSRDNVSRFARSNGGRTIFLQIRPVNVQGLAAVLTWGE
jgi:hypothetical protein